MAIYKLDYVNDEITTSIVEHIDPSIFGYSYGLPNGDSIFLTGEFTKFQADIWIDRYLENFVAETNAMDNNPGS